MIHLARTIWALHVAVVGLMLVAWTLPWTASLWAAVVGYPAIQLIWWGFGNRCPLTLLEEHVRSGAAPAPAAGADGSAPPLHFVASALGLVLGRPVSTRCADAASYVCVWGGFAIAAARLYARQP